MKDSLAAALRHSREQAQTMYDYRTANERKSAALELARRKAEEDVEPSPNVRSSKNVKSLKGCLLRNVLIIA